MFKERRLEALRTIGEMLQSRACSCEMLFLLVHDGVARAAFGVSSILTTCPVHGKAVSLKSFQHEIYFCFDTFVSRSWVQVAPEACFWDDDTTQRRDERVASW